MFKTLSFAPQTCFQVITRSRLAVRHPLALCVVVAGSFLTASAQTGGQGALEGSVLDATGAVVPKASVTATNQATGVVTPVVSSGAGLYSITPLIPGIYTVSVKAQGFQTLTQKNIEVNGLTVTGLNLSLQIGDASETVTVTEAPPQLQTTNPAITSVITQDTYESLPIVMNNQQRDPTALATLATGAQGGTRTPIFSGTGNYLAEVYVEGIPTTTTNQQGDNRIISNGIPVESVEQLQIVSAAPSAEYQGAGAIGFTIKSGTSKFHGQIIDFVRNTAFDTWGFQGNQAVYSSVVNGKSVSVPAGKSIEHQNEISASVGGPIIGTRGRGFFFANYDQFHGRLGVTPGTFTVPTLLMRQGDFTELGSTPLLYNPLTNSCPTLSTCTRQPFQGLKNGLPTYNVIPANYLSPISQYMQQYLPAPTSTGVVNNYSQGGVSGYDNHEYVVKLDYDLPHSQRLSYYIAHGVRQSAGFGATLPVPYTVGFSSLISPTNMAIEHSIGINARMINQIKFGMTRFPGFTNSPTFNLAPYRAVDAGITGLPDGQAAFSFPGTTFGGTTAYPTVQSMWSGNSGSYSSSATTPTSYTLVDNFLLTAGKHNMTFGVQYQRLEDNVISQSSPSGIFYQSFSGVGTSNYVGTTLNSTSTGYSYASFLLGSVQTGATSVPLVGETGGRYRPISPYFQDDWKVRPNLTVNLGVRYDYLTPYQEVKDNYSFFNPTAINSITGTPGQLEYAGFRGANISCQCHTPISTYLGNIGPRLGLEYSPDPNTVFRAGFAIVHSRGGGVGGRAGDSTGTGQAGFGSNIILPAAVTTGVNAGPSYYLNNSDAFKAAGVANTNFGGPGFVIPPLTSPGVAGLSNGTGNYLNAAGQYVTAGGAPGYADPYLSKRAPTFNFWNFGMQKVLTRNLTITATYVGSQSHFVAGAGTSGFNSGLLDPQYIAAIGTVPGTDGINPVIGQLATPANVAIVKSVYAGYKLPYASYSANASNVGSIARSLRPFPQYSAPPSQTFSNVANLSYHAFELTLQQREFKGVSFTVNYTYSRNVGDDGTVRTAFAVPGSLSSNGQPIAGNNRADRDIVATNVPQNLNIYGVVKSPFGKNRIGGDRMLVRALAGGWQLANIFTYASGTPILITGSGCSAIYGATCMPDRVPNRSKDSIRMNGGYGGPGVQYATYNKTQYLDTTAFQTVGILPYANAAQAQANAYITKIGDSPRSDNNLYSPSRYNDDAALQRSFDLKGERVKFIFRADCFDVSNKVTFSMAQTQTVSVVNGVAGKTADQPGVPVQSVATAPFGNLSGFSGNRRFQFSGRITF